MHHATRHSILSQMIDLRRLPACQTGTNVPKAYKIASEKNDGSAEARILEIAELAYLLQADGFPVREVFRRIGLVHSPEPNLQHVDLFGNPLHSYLVEHLKVHAPTYLDLGRNLLRTALCIAELWADLSAERQRGATWPAPQLIEEPGPLAFLAMFFNDDNKTEFGNLGAEGPGETLDILVARTGFVGGQDWRRMKARAVPGDELRNYSTGSQRFAAMMGSAGIALVRNGRSIDHVEMLRC